MSEVTLSTKLVFKVAYRKTDGLRFRLGGTVVSGSKACGVLGAVKQVTRLVLKLLTLLWVFPVADCTLDLLL